MLCVTHSVHGYRDASRNCFNGRDYSIMTHATSNDHHRVAGVSLLSPSGNNHRIKMSRIWHWRKGTTNRW